MSQLAHASVLSLSSSNGSGNSSLDAPSCSKGVQDQFFLSSSFFEERNKAVHFLQITSSFLVPKQLHDQSPCRARTICASQASLAAVLDDPPGAKHQERGPRAFEGTARHPLGGAPV
jgi:hypothetical protein